jgi:hypothetical protein
MAWLSWTRKNKPKLINKPVNQPQRVEQTPDQKALIKKFSEEINNLHTQRNTRRIEWIRKNNKRIHLNNQNSLVFSPYENEAIVYLMSLLRALESDPNPFFFNEAYADFLQTKNDYIKQNTNIFPKRARSVPLIDSVLRKMRLYSKQLENNKLTTPRAFRNSFHNLSTNGSNTNRSSFSSLQNLRNSIQHQPTRRLKGRVVSANLNRPPLEEV